MYTMYLQPIGEIVLHFETLHISGKKIFISGYDDEYNRIDFVMDNIQYPDELPYDCGYCHINEYTMHGITISCNAYRALS